MDLLESSVLKTVTYFDLFDYPLTELELFKWLRSEDAGQVSLADIRGALLSPSSELLHYLDHKSGFIFSRGRSELLKTRPARAVISDRKFKRVIRVIKLFRLIPFLRMAAVCNTLAYQNPKEASDIDLLVIARSGRIWTVRFWVVLILKLFQLRPGEAQRDPICPSFFLTEDNLNLEKIQLPPGDLYLQYWITQVCPIFDPQKVSEKFYQANAWIKTYLPNVIFPQPSQRRRVVDSVVTRFMRKIQEFDIRGGAGNFFESVVKKFQMIILPSRLRQMANQDTRVIISDRMLKFHDDDRREEFFVKYQKRVTNYLLN